MKKVSVFFSLILLSFMVFCTSGCANASSGSSSSETTNRNYLGEYTGIITNSKGDTKELGVKIQLANEVYKGRIEQGDDKYKDNEYFILYTTTKDPQYGFDYGRSYTIVELKNDGKFIISYVMLSGFYFEGVISNDGKTMVVDWEENRRPNDTYKDDEYKGTLNKKI